MSYGEFLGSGSATTKLLLHLNGSSADSSGNNNNGTDTAITYVDGKFGKCASFNGSSSNISNSSASLGLGNITISTWVKPTSLPTSGNLVDIVAKYIGGASATGYEIRLYNNGGTQQIDWVVRVNSTTAADCTKVIALSTTDWTNLVATNNGTTSYLYINGQQVASASIGNPGVASYPFYIGAINYDGTVRRFFPGSIDEVIIENIAWTPQQVAKYYSYTKARFGII